MAVLSVTNFIRYLPIIFSVFHFDLLLLFLIGHNRCWSGCSRQFRSNCGSRSLVITGSVGLRVLVDFYWDMSVIIAFCRLASRLLLVVIGMEVEVIGLTNVTHVCYES